jgi:hypothetical protein
MSTPGWGLGGIDRDLLAVLGGVAPFEPGARLGLFLVRHQAVVLLEVLGPFDGGGFASSDWTISAAVPISDDMLRAPPAFRKPRREVFRPGAEGSAAAGCA